MADSLSGDLLLNRINNEECNIIGWFDSLMNPSNAYPIRGVAADSRLAGKWKAFYAMCREGTDQDIHGYSMLPTANTTAVGCAPGQAPPTEASSCQGWHMRSTQYQKTPSNLADGADFPYHDFKPSFFNDQWIRNNPNLVGEELYIAHANGHTSQQMQRNNLSNQPVTGPSFSGNAASPVLRKTSTAVFNGGDVFRSTISLWTKTGGGEAEAGKCYAPLLRGLRDTSKTTGIQYCPGGEGGWTTDDFASEAGFFHAAQGANPAYTGAFLDEAAIQEAVLMGHNTYMFNVCTNQILGQQWNGTNLGNFKSRYRTMMNRARAIHAAARVRNPSLRPYLGVMARPWPIKFFTGAPVNNINTYSSPNDDWTAADDALPAALDQCFRELWAESPRDTVYLDWFTRCIEVEPNKNTLRQNYTIDGGHPKGTAVAPAGGLWFGTRLVDLIVQGGKVPTKGKSKANSKVVVGF